MQYDDIKLRLGSFFSRNSLSRKLFYWLLDLLLLRAWHIHKEIRRWVREGNSKQAHIMDAGAGFGQHAYYLSRFSNKWCIYAADIRREQICDCNAFFYSQGINNVFFQTQDLTELDKNDTFDLILSVDVLTHIEDDVQVMKNFHKALKTDGMLLLCSPSLQAGTAAFDGRQGSRYENRVRNGYGKKELREKLTQAGFTKIAMRYIYGKAGKFSWKLSLKYPMAMLDTSKYFVILLPLYYLITYPICYVLNWLDMRWNHKKGMGLLVKAWK
jgi:SAM-dependent methyltransferase